MTNSDLPPAARNISRGNETAITIRNEDGDVTTTVESTGDSTEDGRLARKAAFHNKQALDSTFGGN